MKIDDGRSEDGPIVAEIHRKVKAICRALAVGHKPTPEELASRCHACLMTAASLRLIVGGHAGPGDLDDGLIRLMTTAAVDAMEDVLQAELTLRN